MEYANRLASLIIAAGLLGCGLARAQEASPAAMAGADGKPPSAPAQAAAKAAPSPEPDAAGKSTHKPAQAQRKGPPRRRSVQQIVGPAPTVNLGAPSYSPTLTPRGPIGAPPIGSTTITSAPAVSPPIGAVASPVAPAPATINSCAGSLCTDASGSQYNIGTGNAGVNSQGRLCNRVGATVQCF